MLRLIRSFFVAAMVALGFAGCHDTTDMAQPNVTPPPPASFVRLGWRWEPRLVSEKAAAGVALVEDGAAVFTGEVVEWPSKARLRVSDMGVSGRILDVAAAEGERWVLATTCAGCADPKAVLMRVGSDDRAEKGVLIDRVLGERPTGSVWIGQEGPRVVLNDERGLVVFTEMSGGAFTTPVTVDESMIDARATHAAGEDLLAGVKGDRLAVAERSGAGDWIVRVLGRLERTGPELAPTPLLGEGGASVVAPGIGAERSDAMFLYRRGSDLWTSHKIPRTDTALGFHAIAGEDGKSYLLIREAAQATLFDLSDLEAAPRVIPNAGGLSPLDAVVDGRGRLHAAVWVKGMVWLVTPDARNTNP